MRFLSARLIPSATVIIDVAKRSESVQVSTGILDLAELERAAEFVHRTIAPTPQYFWPKLRQRIGGNVWVKHENHTPTGAFKVRGGLVYLDRLRQANPEIAGVISATRGNHGQSIAFAAARLGIPATIYVPVGNSPDQNLAIASFGAKVVEFGRDFDEARHEAARIATAQGLHFVPSYHSHLVAGVASYALELFRAVKELHTVYVGIGMGSGISGLIAARDALNLKTEIVGVVAANAPATALSFAAGRPVSTPSARTFADGLATREPNAQAVEVICRGAARIVQVSEEEIAAAMRVYFDDVHQLAEGAGAAALAGLMQEREHMAAKNVAVVLSGGNIERARFVEILNGHTPSA
jgi:threonine dehydratase